jgi:hypothetical protein
MFLNMNLQNAGDHFFDLFAMQGLLTTLTIQIGFQQHFFPNKSDIAFFAWEEGNGREIRRGSEKGRIL